MTHLNRRMLQLTLASATLASGFSAMAATDLINSLGGLTLTSEGVDITGGHGPLFASFSTTTPFSVTGVQLALNSTFTSPYSFSVGIYSDSSLNPGALIDNLGTFNDSTLTSTESVYTVTPSTPVTLAGGSRYWVGISGVNTSAAWNNTLDTTGTGVANEYYSTGPSGVQSNINGPFKTRVYGNAVPEPSTTVAGIVMTTVAGLSIVVRSARRA